MMKSKEAFPWTTHKKQHITVHIGNPRAVEQDWRGNDAGHLMGDSVSWPTPGGFMPLIVAEVVAALPHKIHSPASAWDQGLGWREQSLPPRIFYPPQPIPRSFCFSGVRPINHQVLILVTACSHGRVDAWEGCLLAPCRKLAAFSGHSKFRFCQCG